MKNLQEKLNSKIIKSGESLYRNYYFDNNENIDYVDYYYTKLKKRFINTLLKNNYFVYQRDTEWIIKKLS